MVRMEIFYPQLIINHHFLQNQRKYAGRLKEELITPRGCLIRSVPIETCQRRTDSIPLHISRQNRIHLYASFPVFEFYFSSVRSHNTGKHPGSRLPFGTCIRPF